MNTVVLGLLYGDEGKGKIVDYYALTHDIVVRFQGGPNAGHTLYRNDIKIVLHQIPSGVLNNKTVVIGNGCIIDVKKLIKEVDMLIKGGYTNVIDLLRISHCAHVILPEHIQKDIEKENSGKGNGSTKCGIGPCYSAKYAREGIRIGDFIKKYTIDDIFGDEKSVNYDTIYTKIKENCICDTTQYLYNMMDLGKSLLFEGAQGAFLSIDNFMYPNVSSSNVDVGGVISGTGVNHKYINNVVGIVKAYNSRVGDGPFVTQVFGEDEKILREAGQEYGATTGRPRKVGWLDLPMVKYISKVVGVDSIALTRLDTLIEGTKHLDKIPICVNYLDKDGFVWNNFPTYINEYKGNVKPQYIAVDKFNMDDINKAVNLYKQTGSYINEEYNPFVNFILTVQKYAQVRVGMISFGRERDQVCNLLDFEKENKTNE